MNGQNINIDSALPRVLVAPLDWGLGHACRMVPLIKLLELQGVSVLIATGGPCQKLLMQELPGREFVALPGYRIKYGRGRMFFLLQLLFQMPRVWRMYNKEHQWLKKLLETQKIDAIISDNRYGLYHPAIPSVFICHQLFIDTGWRPLNKLAQKINYRLIQKFSECWVPDWPEHGLAGKLSHPEYMPTVPVKYMGPLSRFSKNTTLVAGTQLFILLSGPEPHRSIWEQQLISQLKHYPGKAILVRGLPASTEKLSLPANITVYPFLSSAQLQVHLQEASWVICRSGYSTVMDLVALGKKAILVPTPGQGEQEYLARYLMQERYFFSCSQQVFQLNKTIEAASAFTTKAMDTMDEMLPTIVIKNWLAAFEAKQ